MAAASDKTDCPSEELLAKFASGVCDDGDAAELLAHTEKCARCARWLADARDSETVLPSVRDALDAEAKDLKAGRPQETPADWTGVPSLPEFGDLAAHTRDIEGYVLEEEIGRGGMGVVYRAYQKATKRQVALKVLLEGSFASAVTKRRFEREVELAAQLQHPYIVTILESGISSGRYYFAMQHVEGRRLDDYIAASRLSIKQTLQLIGKVCEAVNYAHQRGVIHRDLKPSNIIVDSDGNPHVLDFGLAKLADPSAPEQGVQSLVSVAGQLMGTLAYMSPEQAEGSNQDIDIRTDVYSLGVVLYQALTGRFPYEVVGNVPDVVDAILNIEPARPSKIRAGINDDIETIVLKALSKEKVRRYQTAGNLGQDIARYLAGDTIEAKRNSSMYVLRKLAQRHMYATIIAACILVILCSSALISFDYYRQARAALLDREQKDEALTQRNDQLRSLVEGRHPAVRYKALASFLSGYREDGLERARENLQQANDPLALESAAMLFMLDATYTLEQLLADLPAESQALAYFAAGERHLKANRAQEAIEAFEAAIVVTGDGWTKSAAHGRLTELRQGITSPKAERLAP